MKKHFLSFILLALTLGWSANAWAYTTDGSTYVEFINGDVITFDFSAVNCNDAGVDRVDVGLTKIGSAPYQTATLTFTSTIRCTTSNNRLQVHWQLPQDQGYSWKHGDVEWTEIGTANFPFPTDNSQLTIIVTLDAQGKTLYTWSTGSPPTPSGPCANCKKITK